MPDASLSDLLRKFQITGEDQARVRAAAPLLAPWLPSFVDAFYQWMAGEPEFAQHFASQPHSLERVKHLQLEHWSRFLEAQLDERWLASRRRVGAVHGRLALSHEMYFAGMSYCGRMLVDRLRQMAWSLPEATATADSVTKLVFLDACVMMDEIIRTQREGARASGAASLEPAVTVSSLWDGILLLPLMGALDAARTHAILDKVLARIADTRAKVLVMDISGLGAVDATAAQHLLKITRATQLMGCESLLSGLTPSAARTLVELGLIAGEVRTTATLRDAFELALRAVNSAPAQLSSLGRS